MSVYMAVLLSVIMFFNNTLTLALKYQGSFGISERLLKNAICSALADFDYNVKDKYGLYTMYANSESTELCKNKISQNLNENLAYESANGFIRLEADNLKVSVKGLNNLSQLDKQIVNYCKYRVPLSAAEEFLGRASDLLEGLGVELPEFSAEGEAVLESNVENLVPEEFTEEEYKEFDRRDETNDILKSLSQEKEGGIKISEDIYKNLPSHTIINSDNLFDSLMNITNIDVEQEGAGENLNQCINDIFYDKFTFESIYNEILLDEYILSVFNSKVNAGSNDKSFLKNEAEYILFGNQSDDTNYNFMSVLLLAVRFLFNTIYIYQDEGICAAADAVAYILTAIVEFVGQPLVKHGILLSWSLLESWQDVKLLEAGKTVATYKSESTWKTWFNYDKEDKGFLPLNYKDYLRVFLLMIPREVKLARILDLIQLNELQERSNFNILNSVTYVEAECEFYFEKRKGLSFTKEAFYEY